MAASGETSLTHRDLAKALGVSVTTIKSYRRKFPEFFTLESQGKPIRFPASSKALCLGIKRHFARGLSVEETRKRLAEDFPAHPLPSSGGGLAGEAPVALSERDSLARMGDLLEGLFSLQNRTHSLLAELVAKLDTLADRLGEPTPDGNAAVRPASGTSSLQTQRSRILDGGTSGPAAPRMATQDTETAKSDPPAGGKASGTQAAATGTPSAKEGARGFPAGAGSLRPPAAFLAMPVVVRSGDGEYLGVTRRPGEPFTLAQFEEYLTGRAGGLGSVKAAWENQGEEWVLRLKAGGQAHDHHFVQAVTPRGNTVARFHTLSVGGKPASEAALQAFLRHVKESLS